MASLLLIVIDKLTKAEDLSANKKSRLDDAPGAVELHDIMGITMCLLAFFFVLP